MRWLFQNQARNSNNIFLSFLAQIDDRLRSFMSNDALIDQWSNNLYDEDTLMTSHCI